MSKPPKLSEEQIAQIHAWAADGADLSAIQKQLNEQFGLRLTYMETRFLALDLALELKSTAPVEAEKPEPPKQEQPTQRQDFSKKESYSDEGTTFQDGEGAGSQVKVTVDEIPPAHAIVSGKVTFSTGSTCGWYVDQTGRVGLDSDGMPQNPSQADLTAFQSELRRVLKTQGGI